MTLRCIASYQNISNPDLVRRLSENAPLNELQADKLYGGGSEGYTDYPVMQIVHKKAW